MYNVKESWEWDGSDRRSCYQIQTAMRRSNIAFLCYSYALCIDLY